MVWPLAAQAAHAALHDEGCERDWSVVTKALVGSDAQVEKLVVMRVEWFKDEATGQMVKMRELKTREFEDLADLVPVWPWALFLAGDHGADAFDGPRRAWQRAALTPTTTAPKAMTRCRCRR